MYVKISRSKAKGDFILCQMEIPFLCKSVAGKDYSSVCVWVVLIFCKRPEEGKVCGAQVRKT